ncbi:MAG: aminoacyl-tRNA hydrolase [Candidatus Paceibacterota bacterium]
MKESIPFSSVQIIMGLGNPTDVYQQTYHNVGILAFSYIRERLPEEWTLSETHTPKKSFSYQKLQGPNKKTYLYIQSSLFMNESGRALSDALSFFKIPLSAVLVIHDDSDMALGTYKFSYNQRSAGHRGIESIIQLCGSQEFSRCKIGIRPTQEIIRKKANDFVLKKIPKKNIHILEKEVFHKMSEIIF